MPFDHCRRFDEYQGAEDPRPHSVNAHPQEPIGGMKPEAARALPPQDDQLMSQGDKLEFQRRSAAKPEREHARADRMVIMPPDRTAITQENPQAFLIVHSFE